MKLKSSVVGFAFVLLLTGCSSAPNPDSTDVNSGESQTLSGNCLTIQSEVSNVLPYLSGFASGYSQSDRYAAVSDLAEKLDGILGTNDFTPTERTILRGIADGLDQVKAFYDGEDANLFKAIDSVESGLESINSLCEE